MKSTSPVIRYQGVSFAYATAEGRTSALALDRVSFEVGAGESLGILGPNGGGKSTLLKLTLGLLPMQHGQIDVLGRSPRQAVRERLVGYVPQRQEIEWNTPLNVAEVVSLAAMVGLSPWHRLSADQRQHIDRMLDMTGLTSLRARPIGTLSGGQLQRAMIARALAIRPRVLLLDEPTVGIDPAGQMAFAALLRTLRAELDLTLVIVSHDVRAIAAGCDRVACLSRTLHFHAAPSGLTPGVLAEVFRHDLSGIFGDLHVDAHAAAACAHPHHHPVALSVHASRKVTR